jgi:hypothetical protein
MVIDNKLVASKNTSLPIVRRLEGLAKVTVPKLDVLANALSPISVTLAGMVIDNKLVASKNA